MNKDDLLVYTVVDTDPRNNPITLRFYRDGSYRGDNWAEGVYWFWRLADKKLYWIAGSQEANGDPVNGQHHTHWHDWEEEVLTTSGIPEELELAVATYDMIEGNEQIQ
jgi:hypothetical protein